MHHRSSSSSSPPKAKMIAPRESSFSYFVGLLHFLWLFNVFHLHSCFSRQRLEFLETNHASHITSGDVIVPPVLKRIFQHCCSFKVVVFDFFFADGFLIIHPTYIFYVNNVLSHMAAVYCSFINSSGAYK